MDFPDIGARHCGIDIGLKHFLKDHHMWILTWQHQHSLQQQVSKIMIKLIKKMQQWQLLVSISFSCDTIMMHSTIFAIAIIISLISTIHAFNVSMIFNCMKYMFISCYLNRWIAVPMWLDVSYMCTFMLILLVTCLSDWGQNSYGAANGGDKSNWQKPLHEYCNDDTIDMFPIAFLTTFFGAGGKPEINLANVRWFSLSSMYLVDSFSFQ